jgi:hypothetical protein
VISTVIACRVNACEWRVAAGTIAYEGCQRLSAIANDLAENKE